MRIDEKRTKRNGYLTFYHGDLPEWYLNFEKRYKVKITLRFSFMYDGCCSFIIKDEKDKKILFEIRFSPFLFISPDDENNLEEFLTSAMNTYLDREYEETEMHCTIKERFPHDGEVAKIIFDKQILPGTYVFSEKENGWIGENIWGKLSIKEWIVLKKRD